MKNNFIHIADRMAENASKIKYGIVGVEIKIHDGRIVSVMHSMTEKRKGAKYEAI